MPATLFVAGKRLVHGRRRRIRQVEILVRAAVGEQVGDRRFQGVEPPGQFLDADLHILVARFAEGGQAGQDKAERFDEPGRRRLGLVVVVRPGSSPSNSSSVMDRNMTAAIRPSISPMRSSTSSSVACWRATSASSTLGASTGAASSAAHRRLRCGKRPLAEGGRTRRSPASPARLGDRQQGVRGTLTPHDRRRHGGPRVERQQARPVLGFPGDEHVESGDGRVDGCVHEIGLVGHGGPIMSVGRISGGVAAQRSGHRVDVARLAEVWRQRHRHDVGGHQVVRVGRVTDEHGVVRGDPGV